MGLLAENSGIDVPDKVSGFLPYVTEIVLGIRLLYDIVKTERDFEAVEIRRQDAHQCNEGTGSLSEVWYICRFNDSRRRSRLYCTRFWEHSRGR